VRVEKKKMEGYELRLKCGEELERETRRRKIDVTRHRRRK
jgi:hypothetical protein